TGGRPSSAEVSPGTRRPDDPGSRGVAGSTASDQPAGPAVVPAQRGDDPDTSTDPGTPGGSGPADGPGQAPTARGTAGPATSGGTGPEVPGGDPRPAGKRSEPGRAVPARRPVLTEREMQVLVGMADGKSNAEIGRELFVSEDTVKTHARRLFRKLGARDRAHAVAAGFRAGLVA
ncbi:response regulator transcription factor, partial [Plantactinospora alkalitolerans]|uniref:response regulator transcription factor n=1 Tax=Plantactinospora alkalitolerans TaxID=2789879 RepID=UPI001E452222